MISDLRLFSKQLSAASRRVSRFFGLSRFHAFACRLGSVFRGSSSCLPGIMKRTHGEQGVGIGFQPAESRPT